MNRKKRIMARPSGRQSSRPRNGQVPKHTMYSYRMRTLRMLEEIERGKGLRYAE
jgi:hypothetical protein